MEHHDFSDIKVGDTVYTAEGQELKVMGVQGQCFRAGNWWWDTADGGMDNGGHSYLYRTKPTLTVPHYEPPPKLVTRTKYRAIVSDARASIVRSTLYNSPEEAMRSVPGLGQRITGYIACIVEIQE